jgi:hypothetical protein
MPHAREQIRDAIVTTVTGLTTTSTRVHSNRQYNLTEAELPALKVITGDMEQVEDYSDIYRFLTWDLSVTIEAHAQGKANVDETLEDILAEVQTALAADIQLATALSPKKVWFVNLDAATMDEFDEKAVSAGMLTMEYRVRFRTTAADPTTLIS